MCPYHTDPPYSNLSQDLKQHYNPCLQLVYLASYGHLYICIAVATSHNTLSKIHFWINPTATPENA